MYNATIFIRYLYKILFLLKNFGKYSATIIYKKFYEEDGNSLYDFMNEMPAKTCHL